VTAYAGVTTKSGRAGIAFPLEWVLRITTTGMALFIAFLSLALWGFSMIWHEFAWAMTLFIIARGIRQVVRAYREGKS
jgi:hypothetical protein